MPFSPSSRRIAAVLAHRPLVRSLSALAVATVLGLLVPLAAPRAVTGPRTATSATELSTTRTATAWTPPLSTRGRYIVDADGNRFKLKSGNWHGASGTWNGSGDVGDDADHHAGENSHRIPLGLDRAPMSQIVSGFLEVGVNSIRLPFSNEMVHDQVPVT